MKHRTSQIGLSLVELLVALAISSILILGITQIFISNKRSYAFQQSQTENQEGSRYTLMLLQQELVKAGYRRRPDIALENAFPASDAAGCGFNAGETIKPFDDSRNAVCIRYQPHDDEERDCLGNLPTNAAAIEDNPYTDAEEIIVQRLYMDGTTLRCEAVHVTDEEASSTGDLVSGIADLRFEFGVGSAADHRSVVKYIEEPDGPVLAVRYTALMRSTNRNHRESLTAEDALARWMAVTEIEDDDDAVEELKAADAGNLYQVSQSAVMLRNLLP